MGMILAFERCHYTAERLGNVFHSAGHRIHISQPLGVRKAAELTAKINPVVVTTCWGSSGSDRHTVTGVRRVSRAPIWVISDEPEEIIADMVSDAQLIIPKRYPGLLMKIILRELGKGEGA